MILHSEADIRAAGAAAVAQWRLAPEQVDYLAAIFAPVQAEAYGPIHDQRKDGRKAA